jgi:hypothetical protein
VSGELSPRVRSEIEQILRENWTVDGPFITTLDEVASKVRSEFGMPREFLNLLTACLVLCAAEILDRKDKEELDRLIIRMYLAGLLNGSKFRKRLNGNRT